MNPADLEKLRIGDRVQYSDGTQGTVTDLGYAGLTIAWADNCFSTIRFREADYRLANLTRLITPAV